jgi:hypothetical protein
MSAPRANAETQRRGPGIVEHDERAFGVRDCRDRGHILHFEGKRARRLGEHQPRVRSEFAFDGRARQRIVVTHFDAEELELVVAEASRRTIDRIGD